MPRHYPDYPSHRQILQYVRGFAQAFGLREAIRFETPVARVEKEDGGLWSVTLGSGERRRYRALICATGCNWDPNLPSFKGHFDGEVRHSVSHVAGEDFKGKRVLVVGLGNSGADIACDAAIHADRAFISVRRGYHFIPKHVLGKPVDHLAETGPHLPLWLARPLFGALLRLTVGDVTRFGLPRPDHRLFESHPLLNSQLLHYLQHGEIVVRPDISHLDGQHVVFADGSREAIDLVLCATGYRWSCPYAADYFTWKGGRPQLYLSMFSRQHRNLFGIGYLETNSSAYKLFDTQAHLIASYLRAHSDGAPSAERFDALIESDQPDLSGGIRFVGSERHAVYLDAHATKDYLRQLRSRMGWRELDEHMYEHLRHNPADTAPEGGAGKQLAAQGGAHV